MGTFADDLLTAIERPDALARLRDRCREAVQLYGVDQAGDMFDALTHAAAVVHEGHPEFTAVIRTLASISACLEVELHPHDAFAVAV